MTSTATLDRDRTNAATQPRASLRAKDDTAMLKAAASLTRSVAEYAAREGWQLDEIHTEEGRLDEVFRAITLPDTIKAAA